MGMPTESHIRLFVTVVFGRCAERPPRVRILEKFRYTRYRGMPIWRVWSERRTDPCPPHMHPHEMEKKRSTEYHRRYGTPWPPPEYPISNGR